MAVPPVEGADMSKPTITRLFVGSLIAFVSGVALLLVAGGLAYVRSDPSMHGADLTGFRTDALGWTLIGLAGLALLVMFGAVVLQFVAWVAALLNAARLENKGWFVVLLLTSLLSFGFLGMVIYLVAAPDSEAPRTPGTPQAAGFGESPGPWTGTAG